ESTKTKDILKAVWKNNEIQGSITEINKLLPGELVTDIHTAKTKLNELSSFSNQFIESLKIAYSSTKGKKLIGLAVFVFVFIGTYFIYSYKEGFQQGLNAVALRISALVSFLVQLIGFITPAMGKIKTAYKSLKSLEKTFTELENKEKADQQVQLISLQKELDAKKEEQQKQEVILKELQQLEIKLQDEIRDIISGKKLNHFIESKVTDPRYINSLGIISWIRKDFEELDFLLKIQHEATEEKLKELGRIKVDNIFKIDRIILYIDDLDRCNEEIVVRVLEAIHLLLAFPLFVVVVGVDPRWMHNALSLKYKEFLQQKAGGPQQFQIGETLFKEPATSFDYLEKIFQIPFALKPINDTGRKKLIDSQLESIVKKEEDTSKGTLGANASNNGKQETGSGNDHDHEETGNSSGNTPLPNGKGTKAAAKNEAYPILLQISKEELQFMKSIAFMIGDSPRTIKRYINIFRIIRSHARFTFYDKEALEHYAASMILLGIITGIPALVGPVFKLIENANTTTDFKTFVADQSITFSKNPDAYSELKKCVPVKCGNITVGDISLKKFKINLKLVSRFSFRYLD
ncbi:MAG: P-loop NTPase fold protein, partial [Chitinophagaceae bacterium]